MKVLKSVLLTLCLATSTLNAALWDSANTIYNDSFSLTLDSYTTWGNLMNGYALDAATSWEDYTIKPETVIGSVLDYWDNLLVDPVVAPITINLTTASLGGTTLGRTSASIWSSGQTYVASNGATYNAFTGAEAKATGFLGNNLSFLTGYDMTIQFSSDYAFSFTDEIASDGYDFASVLLHEITHGMGFTSGRTGSSDSDQITWGSRTTCYDALMGFTSGDTATTGSAIYIDANGETYLVYNPDTFASGSSISHLDDSVNAIMNYSIGMGENQREFTQADLAVLGALGYNLNTIPEPSSAMLFLFGTGLLLTRRNRKQA